MSGLFGGGGSAGATVMPTMKDGMAGATGSGRAVAKQVMAMHLKNRKPWLANSILGGGDDSDGGASAAAGDAASAAADGGGVSI
jgi:DNA-binding transcriptional regulator LsrR (DeoR family)